VGRGARLKHSPGEGCGFDQSIALANAGSGSFSRPMVEPAPPDELTRAQRRIRELERKVGQQQVELDFFSEPCGRSGRRGG
jgi:hypothetical protein